MEHTRQGIEVLKVADTQQNPLSELVGRTRERLEREISAQAEPIQQLEQTLQDLRGRQEQLREAVRQQLAELERVELPPAPSARGAETSLEKVLGAVRNLITATLPEQVQAVLTEEAEQLGVRAAVFDVRGKAAWGSSARGFGPEVSDRVFRGLVVPLNQNNPFRTCYETGGHVDANAEILKKNRNVLDKLRPAPDDPILLLPIRSAGSVSAIFYADPGGKPQGLPVDALKILAEFAGAQLDRLMAFSGAVPVAAESVEAEAAEAEAVVEEPAPFAEPEPTEIAVEAIEPEPEEPVAAAAAAVVPGMSVPAVEAAAVIEESPPAPVPAVAEVPAAAPVSAPAGFDLGQLSEAEQKLHRDAKRFARLLVSEIELYNKGKVAEGRRNKDLYKRLKTDIDRSRQTYEKRFGKTEVKQFDYFHEELVRTLAASDASLLGSEYPGPAA
jgi:hypothetical protein